jgi:hypothetical protein
LGLRKCQCLTENLPFVSALKKLGVETVEVRKPEQLKNLSGLIIPGGESTTMAKLAEEYNLVCGLLFPSYSSSVVSVYGNFCCIKETPVWRIAGAWEVGGRHFIISAVMFGLCAFSCGASKGSRFLLFVLQERQA